MHCSLPRSIRVLVGQPFFNIYQTTNFNPCLNSKHLQMTILMWLNKSNAFFFFYRVENIVEKQEKMLVTSIFSSSYNVFKRPFHQKPSPHGLDNRRPLVRSLSRQIFFPSDDSHCDRIHSSLTAVLCCHSGYEGKQPAAWKEYCAEMRALTAAIKLKYC